MCVCVCVFIRRDDVEMTKITVGVLTPVEEDAGKYLCGHLCDCVLVSMCVCVRVCERQSVCVGGLTVYECV